MSEPNAIDEVVEHEPQPFGDELGGGVRCSCGWEERTKPLKVLKNRDMRTVWEHYREHWSVNHPDTRQPVEWDVEVEERHLFDPNPYKR